MVDPANEEKTDKTGGRAARLFPPGNALRVVRGGLTALVASFFGLLLMAHAGHLRWGVPLGGVFVAIASWGLMDLLGTFDDAEERVACAVSLRELAPTLAAFFASVVLFCGALAGAQAGWALPQPAWGALVFMTFLGSVIALYGLGRRFGAWRDGDDGRARAVPAAGDDRPLWRRHGFWVVVAGAALYLPFLGSYALWDPWETHYGEVSREMLARDDWISLWWAQDGWFLSKPVLDMWMQAISMATLGVHYQPDKMLVGDGARPVMHPEWAARAPVVLLALLAMYLLYKGIAKAYGRLAALLGSLVLATTPDWYFIAHQTMTDMPFVGAMTASLGLVLIGLHTPEDVLARSYEVRVGDRCWRLTAWHLVFGAVTVSALPQILYLLSRNIEFVWRPDAHGFRLHWDEFRSGSGGGNCGLPGNAECTMTLPAAIPRSVSGAPESFAGAVWRAVGAFEPALQGLLWATALGTLLCMNRGERRLRRLYYLAAWFFAAVSTLGKGPAGFGLPVLVTLAYLFTSGPAEDLLSRLSRVVRELTQFEIVSGLVLIVPVVALPWYVAMYVRHGSPFTDELLFHDMLSRAFEHVHDTNEGDDTSFRFYVWQLGYALFPWTGLAPLGVLWSLRRDGSQDENDRAGTGLFLCFWFVLGFALFSFMGTKFHHYILPAVPPIAMLIGVVLRQMIGQECLARAGRLSAYVAGLTAGATLLVVGVTWTQAGSFFGTKPGGHLSNPCVALGVGLLVVGVTAIAGVVARLEGPSSREDASSPADAHASRMLAAGAVAGALLLALVARDLIVKPDDAGQPGAIRLLQLFTYNYRRRWPESLDFTAALEAFGAVGVAISLALASRPLRRHSVVAMCALAFLWGLWGLDVYMTKTAPHWGQRDVIAAYYADRASADEILVAYQMNWKGENFYSGNRIPAFQLTGSAFTTWLKKKRDDGAKTMYFITEHGRLGVLKNEVAAKSYREITDKTLCNKFVLVRAEL
jgi:4-amino-4-deoxy-L-arabinose transferase-like glycosyltransferase